MGKNDQPKPAAKQPGQGTSAKQSGAKVRNAPGTYGGERSSPKNKVNYKKAATDHVIQNEGAYITLGKSRMSSVRDGPIMYGCDDCAMIDLVVGRMASAGKNNQGLTEPADVDNSIAADAARIMITQLASIDKAAGLAEGHAPNSLNRSAILVKADAVRIVGREDVKIITGAMDGVEGYPNGETNSLGGKIRGAGTIELIAGNSTADRTVWGGIMNPWEIIPLLQPAAMGYLTRDALMELESYIEDLWSHLFAFVITQMVFNSAISATPWTFATPALGAAVGAIQTAWTLEPMWHTRVNNLMWTFNYLYPFGYKFICSRNVKIT